MRYIIYARKSTESEERQVLSIESQISELKEFATKEKLEIVASLCEAQTAKEPGRTKFAEMLSFLQNGKAEGILSWNPDRLARNSIDGGQIIYFAGYRDYQRLEVSNPLVRKYTARKIYVEHCLWAK